LAKDSIMALRKKQKSTRRPRRLPAKVREQLIIEEAVRFFADVGFDGQTRELARRLGVTQALLYRYFPNKKKIIESVYEKVYLSRWKPEWLDILKDRDRTLHDRLSTFYKDYTRTILTYEWVRIFMFSGLKGVSINERYLTLVKDDILKTICIEVRAHNKLPDIRTRRITENEMEILWALHGGMFYMGIRKWIYGLPVPDDLGGAVDSQVSTFLDGFPKTQRQLVGTKKK